MTSLRTEIQRLCDKVNATFSDAAHMRDDLKDDDALKAHIVKWEEQLRQEAKEVSRLMEHIIDMAKNTEFPQLVYVGKNAFYWRVGYDTYVATKSPDEIPTLKSGYRSLDAIMKLKGEPR